MQHTLAISMVGKGFVLCQGTSFSCRTRQSIKAVDKNTRVLNYGASQAIRIDTGRQALLLADTNSVYVHVYTSVIDMI